MHIFHMLNSVAGEMYIIPSANKFPQNVPNIRISEALYCNQRELDGLAQRPKLKVNARVMRTVNIGIEDRLVNGQFQTIMQITTDIIGNVTKICCFW